MNIKNIKYMVLAAAAVCLTTSCEKDLEPYSNPDCYVNFVIKSTWNDGEATSEDIEQGYSDVDVPVAFNFKTKGAATQDTVWVNAKISGFVRDYDRTFAIEQVMMDGADNAVAGTDYVPFDNADVQKHMVVKGGEVYFKVPVVVLRSETLKNKTLTLAIRFKENENFKPGFELMQQRIVTFTDRLSKPTVWDDLYLDYILGAYGDVKYQLMIEWSGEPWDDDYISEIYEKDSYYLDYMCQVFAKRLEAENAKRLAQGLDVYREADGTEVEFAPMGW